MENDRSVGRNSIVAESWITLSVLLLELTLRTWVIYERCNAGGRHKFVILLKSECGLHTWASPFISCSSNSTSFESIFHFRYCTSGNRPEPWFCLDHRTAAISSVAHSIESASKVHNVSKAIVRSVNVIRKVHWRYCNPGTILSCGGEPALYSLQTRKQQTRNRITHSNITPFSSS